MKQYTVKELIAKAISRPVKFGDPNIFTDHQLNTFPLRNEGDSWNNFLKSVDEFGIIHPILVDFKNRIISGKRRNQACKEKGIPVPYFKLPNHSLSNSKIEAIILVCNITSRHIEREAIDTMWDKVYGNLIKKELSKGKTPYQITKKISDESGINMRTARRHVYRIQNALILEKYRTIDDLKVEEPAKLKALIQEEDMILSRIVELVKEYQDNRRIISSIIRPALVGINEVIVQQKTEDVVSAVTGVPEVSLRGANFPTNEDKEKEKELMKNRFLNKPKLLRRR
jgi:hypothetical protein